MRTLATVLVAVAAAGCVVSTSDLKPRTDDQCVEQVAGTKACGNRCVSVDDPSTGCGTPGDCQPCPAPAEANTVAACVSGACSLACTTGYADCNGLPEDGCEINLQGSDAAHCGHCTHSCGTGVCSGGVCSATEVIGWTGAVPTVMAQDRTDGTTILYGLTPPEAFTTTVGVTSQICRLNGPCSSHPGKVTALAAHAGTWWAGIEGSSDLAIVEIPPAGPAVVTTVASASYFGDEIDAIVVTSLSRLVYTTIASHQDPTGPRSNLHVLARGGAPAGISVAATEGAPRGIGGLDPFFFVGTPDGGGSLYRYEDLATVVLEAALARSGAPTPTRITTWSDGAGTDHLFWTSWDDGSVWRAILDADGTVRAPERIAAPSGPTAHMEIVGDADGVFWCNHGTGFVTRWRPEDGAVFHLGWSSSPSSIATDSGGRVYWSDDVDNKIYRTVK